MSRLKTANSKRNVGNRARNKEVLLSLVRPEPPIPIAEADVTLLMSDIDVQVIEEQGTIIDKRAFYLIRKGEKFICMKRGASRDTTDEIFDNLEDALFHMENQHG
jgi:hypothetical protein